MGDRAPATVDFGAGTLRLPTDDDTVRIVAVCNDDDVVRFTGVDSPYGIDEAAAFVDRVRRDWQEGRLSWWAVDVDGTFVGDVGVVHVDEMSATAEVGYLLGADHRRRGLATAAVASVVNFLFIDRRLHRLELQIASSNEASVALARRVGFLAEGTKRDAVVLRGVPGRPEARDDLEIWGLLRSEWETGRPAAGLTRSR